MTDVLIYCESCQLARPMRIDEMRTDELNAPKIWGDLCCSVCHLVICTITVPEPGIYEFQKVREC